VLHVCHSLIFGGVESHLTTLARTPGTRYDHHFCGIGSGGEAAEAIRRAAGDASALNIDPWKNPVRAFRTLVMHVRRLRPVVVHSHGLEGNLIGMPAAWYSRVPVRIAEEIGIAERSLKGRIVLRGTYGLAHRIVAVSEAVRTAIVNAREAPARKIVPIYNPVELPPRRAKPRVNGETFRIGFVGRLHPAKNPLSLVQALTLVQDNIPIELRIVGEGHERDAIEEFIRSNNLEQKVSLTGFRPEPDAFIGDCHLYVQPSHTEGFGIALVEAMGCGLPVIATTRGGMGEIVENGVTGWLIPSGSPREIADAIQHAMQLEPSKLAEIGMAARRSVEDRFSPARYVQEIEELYDECLA
jgi:glycosyltransferase involved in cell wall biosynthesis